MNYLEVKKLRFDKDIPALNDLSVELDNLGDGNKINIINWNSYSYKPEVRFNIAYSKKELFIKYYIRENYIRAEKQNSNEMVCEDSCVEVFLSPPGEEYYLNFEFNCIGTCYLGKGFSREDSKTLDPDIIKRIRRTSSLGTEPFMNKKGEFNWNITIAIPIDIFIRDGETDLKNCSIKANFYKCGDKLNKPHYLSWSEINTQDPDFHRPEFFGQLKFV